MVGPLVGRLPGRLQSSQVLPRRRRLRRHRLNLPSTHLAVLPALSGGLIVIALSNNVFPFFVVVVR